MEVKYFSDNSIYSTSLEIERIGNIAIKLVQQENRTKGIPLVYSVDNKIFYELADGSITTQSPF